MRMEHKVKALQETMTIFNERKTGLKRILFSIDELDTKLLKKLKKSSYTKDKQLLKLIDLLENNKKKIEKREINRSTLYSFDGFFQFLHTDIANLEFLGKSASLT